MSETSSLFHDPRIQCEDCWYLEWHSHTGKPWCRLFREHPGFRDQFALVDGPARRVSSCDECKEAKEAMLRARRQRT